MPGVRRLSDRRRRGAPTRYDWTGSAAVVACGAVAVLALVGAVHVLGWDFRLMARDPISVARAGDDVDRHYVGWVSHAGVLGWAAAAATGLAGARMHRGDRGRAALMVGGLLSLGLAVDDLYLVHESLVPRYTPLPEETVLAGWAVVTVAWLVGFRRWALGQRALPLLVVAGVALGASVAADLVGAGVLTEESLKLFGVGVWTCFLWRAAIGSPASAPPLQSDADAE